MYRKTYRRSSSFRRPIRRRGTGLHLATPPRRWEVCEFFAESDAGIPSGSAAELASIFHLASISNSFNAGTSVGEITTGLVMSSQVRQLEIGGIVLDYGLTTAGQPEVEIDRLDTRFHVHYCLYTDNMAQAGGSNLIKVPTSAMSAWSPFISGFPVSLYGASTPQGITLDSTHPTRVHWQKTEERILGAKIIPGPEQTEGSLYAVDELSLHPRHQTLNRRLRLRLDDQQGLYFQITTRNCVGFAVDQVSRECNRFIRGTLYYRMRY